MFRPFVITFASAGLLAGAATAAAPIVGTTVGHDAAGIAAALSAESYDITRFERLPEAISVTAFREGSRLELALDSGTGAVIGLAEYDRAPAARTRGVGFAAVQAMLAGQGYTLIDYQRETDEIDVHATRDGVLWELEVDPLSGRIDEVEAEAAGS
jgi:hypothetical protein